MALECAWLCPQESSARRRYAVCWLSRHPPLGTPGRRKGGNGWTKRSRGRKAIYSTEFNGMKPLGPCSPFLWAGETILHAWIGAKGSGGGPANGGFRRERKVRADQREDGQFLHWRFLSGPKLRYSACWTSVVKTSVCPLMLLYLSGWGKKQAATKTPFWSQFHIATWVPSLSSTANSNFKKIREKSRKCKAAQILASLYSFRARYFFCVPSISSFP